MCVGPKLLVPSCTQATGLLKERHAFLMRAGRTTDASSFPNRTPSGGCARMRSRVDLVAANQVLSG